MTAPVAAPMDAFDPTADAVLSATMRDSTDLIGTADQQSRARDEHGRFVADQSIPTTKDGEWNVLPDGDQQTPVDSSAPPAQAQDGEGEPETVTIPEGFVAPALLPPEKVQGFKVRDADGEIEVPDLKFDVNFRVVKNGKEGTEVRELDMPQLVNYARMGIYNHEKEQHAVQVQQDNRQLATRVQQVEQFAQQQLQEIEKLLSDPDYLLGQLKRYEQENTPEARLAKERDQIRQERERSQFENVAQVGQSFVDREIGPAIELITKACPTIDQEEVAARILLLLEPHKVRTPYGTTIAPNAYQAIRDAITSDVVMWAQQVHESRSSRGSSKGNTSSTAPADEPKDAKVEKLQVRAAKARRVATAALKPIGGTGTPQGKPAAPDTRSPRNLEDAIVGRSLSAMGVGG